MVEVFEEFPHFFEVKLDVFDGPIDLLLHLVKQNELPIEKVSLATVASQYLGCLEKMRSFDLEVAGEYLLIAATLLSIKSSILLKKPVELVVDEEGNLFDPHEELLRRLREAEVYKEGAGKLGGRDLLGMDVFSTPPSVVKVSASEVQYAEHDPLLLGKAFRKLLAKVKEDPSVVITVDTVSVVERMMGILEQLKQSGDRAAFHELIPDLNSRYVIISSLIAMLELCKRAVIRIVQDREYDDIFVSLATTDVDVDQFSSEFDQGFEQSVTAHAG